jgi:hypothetical protein
MNNLFNDKMTSIEARIVLYSNVDGKSDEEKKELFKAYKNVLPAIIERETYEGSQLLRY